MISSEDIVQTDIFWLYKPCDLFFKDHILIIIFNLNTTLQLMLMHHHTTLAYKRSSSSEAIFWIKPGHAKGRWTCRHNDSSSPLSPTLLHGGVTIQRLTHRNKACCRSVWYQLLVVQENNNVCSLPVAWRVTLPCPVAPRAASCCWNKPTGSAIVACAAAPVCKKKWRRKNMRKTTTQKQSSYC